MDRNPFEILGLNPEFVRSLDNSQLEKIIISQYRALQKLFHPDKGGDKKRSSEINLAYQSLDKNKDPKLFKAYRDQFVKKLTRARATRLKEDVREAAEKTDLFYGKLIDYIESYAYDDELNIFNAAPINLGMHDWSMAYQLLSAFSSKKELAKAFYELLIDDEGNISHKRGESVRNYPNKKLVGTIDEITAIENGGIKDILRRVQPMKSPHQIAIEIRDGRPQKSGEYKNIISPSSFRELIQFMSPRITPRSYLFSINRSEDVQFYSLEGRVMKIHEE